MISAPEDTLPHVAEFNKVLDEVRGITGRSSQEWHLLYLAYIAGRTDATRDETGLMQGKLEQLENRP